MAQEVRNMTIQLPHDIRGVIFDLDGTLIDTLDDMTASLNDALTSMGFERQTRDAFRAMVGDGMPKLLQRASGTDDEELLAELLKRYRPIYAAKMLETTRLFEGISSVLDGVVQKGIKRCILSNKPHSFTVPICEALLARWPFDRIQGAEDGMPRKPDPIGARHLCETMQLAPAQALFVGDSPVDVLTAQNAGMASVAVTWGYQDRGKLEAAKPWRLVSHPSELEAVLFRDA
jgi:phosphoglycolate phosphatase